MKPIYIVLALLILTFSTYGQITWSKEYDLGEGLGNFLFDLEILKGDIYINSEQFCPSDSPIDFYQCHTISAYTIDGFLKHSKTYTKSGLPKNKSFITKDSVIFLFHEPNIGAIDTFEMISIIDSKLNVLDTIKLEFSKQGYSLPRGIEKINDSIYLYGTTINYANLVANAFIARLDNRLNMEIIAKYPARQLNVFMNDLQATPDGNLAFILKHQGPAGPSSKPGFEIFKVNHSGEKLDSFIFDEPFGLNWPFSLTIDEEGNYYFFSDDHPINGFPSSIGRVNKLNKDMKTLEWSVILPNSTYGRNYKIEESLLANNGDIIVCGSVLDQDEDFDGPHTVNTGFITRLDQAGNILWHHLYKVPNNEYLPQSEYGRYRQSQLKKIVEVEDGTLLAGGNHFYHHTVYNHPNFDSSKERNLLWLLKVDADGCLEGEECDEVIEIGRGKSTISLFVDTNKEWLVRENIGTTSTNWWTFYFGDSLVIGGNLYHELMQTESLVGNISRSVGFFRQEDGEVYRYIDTTDSLHTKYNIPVGDRLYYDFSAQFGSNYDSYNNSILLEIGDVGETSYIDGLLRKTIYVFGIQTSFNTYTYWVEGIGDLESGPLGSSLLGLKKQFDFELICYKENGNVVYTKNGFDCMPVSTVEVENGLRVYPNPANQYLNTTEIKHSFTEYEIYNINGVLLKKGLLNDAVDINDIPEGLYVLSLSDKKSRIIKLKFVKTNR